MKTHAIKTELIWESDDDPLPELEVNDFVTALFAHLDMPTPELDILITDDLRMQKLNRQYRNRDKTTDVLSFPSGAPQVEGRPRHLGDIVISLPQAKRQALDIGHGVEPELRFLILHGTLHLLGYDHETDDGQMIRLQSQLKTKLGNFFETTGGPHP